MNPSDMDAFRYHVVTVTSPPQLPCLSSGSRRAAFVALRTRRSLTVFLFVVLAAVTWAPAAFADKAAFKAQQGMMWFRWKKCHKAVPLLEEAELLRHQAHVALALADCYAKSDRLMEAVEIYRALAREEITKRHYYRDRIAIRKAEKRLEEAEARIPTLAFELPVAYEDLEVFVNGDRFEDPETPKPLKPGEAISLVVRAKGYEEMRDEITLAEGERLVRPLKLDKAPPKKPVRKKKNKRKRRRPGDGPWFGARGRGYAIPGVVWKVFGEGGATVLAPGAALTLTNETDDADLMFSLGYASYALGPTPFKPKDAPDTDWEIIESDLHAAYATVEIAWRDSLNDDGTWEYFWGVGAGVGWTFAGNITRTQAYPPNLVPGDPSTYEKCRGPNDPPGSYVYCNQLDHDADHYYDYHEPSWFTGGKRPLIYPWFAFPQFGLTYKASDATAIDIETGLTTGGLLFGLGIRSR